jgi:hypothetical protein
MLSFSSFPNNFSFSIRKFFLCGDVLQDLIKEIEIEEKLIEAAIKHLRQGRQRKLSLRYPRESFPFGVSFSWKKKEKKTQS